MKLRNKTIAITLGDPCGVGPEVVTKALKHIKASRAVNFLLIGDQKIFKSYGGKLSANVSFCPVISTYDSVKCIGQLSKASGLVAKTSLDYAIRLIKINEVDALVTAPVSKEAIAKIDSKFHGHTEYLAKAFDAMNVEMLFVAERLRTVIATRHIALKDVPSQIQIKKVYDSILMMDKALKNLFKIKNPRLGVLGLNPHAGENGLLGQEDLGKIWPAIKLAKSKRVNVAGPLSADTAFTAGNRKNYDGIIAMYHDQGLAPMKALYFNRLVNLTLGLPFIRTSPAHGTAFDIAGKNKADPCSMIEAIDLAINLSSNF